MAERLRVGCCLLAILSLFARETMSDGAAHTVYINGSLNTETICELKITNSSFRLLFRGETEDSHLPGIGVFTGSTRELQADQLRELLGKKAANGLTPYLYVSRSFQSLFDVSTKEAKLDVTTTLVRYQGQLLVDVAFSNSGSLPFVFPSPNSWEGSFNPILMNSWVFISAYRLDNLNGANPRAKFSTLWLGADQLLNKQDFPGDTVRVDPGRVRHAKFLAWPTNEFLSGRYEVNSMVSIRGVAAPEELKGYVEFSGQDSYADFNEDYPYSLQEKQKFDVHLKGSPAATAKP
ncbi:hypothetical protein [Caballeronia sp. AZ10_KS36]|uniref:hypothetical protein n=1 Tax=Caballeronia sp. AZ10_KS36 TaxID=2921757 RepID=UPI002027E161|nr:hypothetical protein [Caballeronia sp. AZ10_KS36]